MTEQNSLFDLIQASPLSLQTELDHLLNPPNQALVQGDIARVSATDIPAKVLVEPHYRRNRECLIKLLDANFYVEQKPTLYLSDKFWVSRAASWRDWPRSVNSPRPMLVDQSGYRPDWLIVGWLFGGVRLIVKTVSKRREYHGRYLLVRFERGKKRRKVAEFAHPDTTFDFGKTNPYELLNTELEADPSDQASWKAEYLEKLGPLRFLEDEALSAARYNVTLFQHLRLH